MLFASKHVYFPIEISLCFHICPKPLPGLSLEGPRADIAEKFDFSAIYGFQDVKKDAFWKTFGDKSPPKIYPPRPTGPLLAATLLFFKPW